LSNLVEVQLPFIPPYLLKARPQCRLEERKAV